MIMSDMRQRASSTPESATEPTAAARRTHEMGTLILAGIVGLGVYLSYRLMLPFLSAIVWAAVLGILVAPIQPRLEKHVRNPNVAAFISSSVAAIVVTVPLIFVVQQLVREAADGAALIQRTLSGSEWRDVVAGVPVLPAIIGWIEQRLDLAGAVGEIARWLTAQSGMLLRGSINQAVLLLLVFYILFYFLRDRGLAARTLEHYSPLNGSETEELVSRVVDTVHATVFGTLMVAAVQGALGGLIFWWLGLPAPAFWGLVMGLLAIIPVLGAFIIWLPTAVFLALEGDWVSALILVVWGGVIIATIDNLLYPVFVGSRLKLHTLLAFFGAVGGIILFGAAGLVLGPATISVTLALVAILKRRFRREAAPPG